MSFQSFNEKELGPWHNQSLLTRQKCSMIILNGNTGTYYHVLSQTLSLHTFLNHNNYCIPSDDKVQYILNHSLLRHLIDETFGTKISKSSIWTHTEICTHVFLYVIYIILVLFNVCSRSNRLHGVTTSNDYNWEVFQRACQQWYSVLFPQTGDPCIDPTARDQTRGYKAGSSRARVAAFVFFNKRTLLQLSHCRKGQSRIDPLLLLRVSAGPFLSLALSLSFSVSLVLSLRGPLSVEESSDKTRGLGLNLCTST